MLLASQIQAALPVVLFVIMLALGMTLTAGEFRRVLLAPRAFATGLAGQLLALPLLGLAVVVTFDLSGEMAVGLMVLSFCPSGTTSNLFSHLARADVALSICLTGVASLVTPFTIPVLTALSLDGKQIWQVRAGDL